MVAEINLGQLSYVLRANYLRDVISLNQIRGKPFTVEQVREKIKENW
jgi:2-oxoglutarate ferredoxin oxidoreductase subunit alpha